MPPGRAKASCVTLVSVTPRLRIAKKDLMSTVRRAMSMQGAAGIDYVMLEETLMSLPLLFPRTMCSATLEANSRGGFSVL